MASKSNKNADTDIILNIEVKYEKAINGIVDYQKSLDGVKQANAALKKQVKEGTISEDKYRKAIAANNEITTQYKASISLLRKEIQNNITTEIQQEGSLKSLRASLSKATKEFDELSRSARNGLDGEKLLEDIKNLQEELSEAEQASGRFQRNVGNYQSINAEVLEGLSAVDPVLGGIIQKLQASPKFVSGLSKSTQFLTQTLKLSSAAATGLQFALVGLAAAGIYLVVEAIKTWQKEQEKLNEIQGNFIKSMAEDIATLNILFDRLKDAEKGTKEYAKAKSAIQDKYGDYLKNQSKEIRNLDDASKSYDVLTEAILANARAKGFQKSTEDAAKEFSEDFAKAFKNIGMEFDYIFGKENGSKLANEFVDGFIKSGGKLTDDLQKTLDDFTVKYKKKMESLTDNPNIPLQTYIEDGQKAIDQLNRSTKQANILFGDTGKAADEATGAIGIQEKALKDLELQYGNLSNLNADELKAYNKKRQAIETEISRLKELGKVKIADPKEERKAAMELARYELSTEINTKKEIADNDKKTFEERLTALNSYYNLKKGYIKKDSEFQLNQEGLTKSQKALINAKADKEQKDLDKELSDKALKIMQDEDARQLSVINTNIQNRLATIKKGSQEELNLKIQQLELQRQAEVKAAQKIGADVAAINEKYFSEERKLRDDHNKYINSKQHQEYEIQIAEAKLKNQNTLQIQLADKQAEIENLQKLEGESDEAFMARKLNLQLQEKQLQDDLTQYQIDNVSKYLGSISTIAGGFTSLFESLAEDNEKFASFAKAMALFQIGIDTAEALTSGIKQSQKVGPFPANIAAIATTVSAVLANIVKAKKYFSSAKQPKAPSFATGGFISGAGSGTSDSIQANLSNGESVLTARATEMFSPIISAFNQIGGGVPIVAQGTSNQIMGEEMLSRAFAKAVSSLPNPIVGIKEITDKTNQVKTIEQTASL